MNDIREDLKAYVDGELSEARAAEIEAAIAADPELAQEAEFMKMLGFEIRRAAADPEVAGRAFAIEKVRNANGRFASFAFLKMPFAFQTAIAIGCCALIGAVFFPVFAQSKSGALRTTALSRAKQEAAAGEMAKNKSADMPATASPAEEAPYAFANGRDAGGGPSDNGRIPGGLGFQQNAELDAKSRVRTETSDKTGATNQWHKEGETQPGTTVPMKGSNRLVVKNADVNCRVPSVADAMAKSGSIAEGLGGFVINSNSSDLKGENPTGMVVMRVPAVRFDSAMKQIRALGDVINESSSGQDVTAQVADTGARIKVLKAEEESYITMLRAARRVGEMLEIKERLSGVRQEIESLTAQVLSLKDLASLSTITATFEEKTKKREAVEEPKGAFEETWNTAVNGLQAGLQFLGSVVIFIFVYSPFWLPVVGVLWWANRKNRKV